MGDISITHYPLPITNYQLPITYYLLPITYYLLPITSKKSMSLAICLTNITPQQISNNCD